MINELEEKVYPQIHLRLILKEDKLDCLIKILEDYNKVIHDNHIEDKESRIASNLAEALTELKISKRLNVSYFVTDEIHFTTPFLLVYKTLYNFFL